MAMAGAVPRIVVLALGAGALGGPDALRHLIALAGHSPVVDIVICVFVFAVVTAQLLGAVLLVRFVRKSPAAGAGARRGAPSADPFAQITLLLSLAAAFLVTACLVVFSGLGTVVVIANAAVGIAGAFLPYAMPLLRVFREPWNARAAAPAHRATTTRHTVRFIGLPLVAAVCALLVAIPFGARGGLDALRLSPGFTTMAVAVVVGSTLLVRFYRRARNAAAVGSGDVARASATAPRTPDASTR
ncbi:hypothetical protein BAE44_0010911 [Dichanthelium oligosanthes]|uniref:Uncharacterized protein n=1 Tax=Dichanthelium oligosanthes TaxID=888268 RepID=A0A1E5VSH8_9POAL|nr:hypothetical protein BAE44_0010911 [Dichanthelium oligosanthes]